MNTRTNNNEDDTTHGFNRGLSGINPENNFSVPEGYFEKLPLDIMRAIDSIPSVEKVSSENPFSIPENYFEKLPNLINQRIADQRKATLAEKFGIIFKPKYVLAAITIALAAIFTIRSLNHADVITPANAENDMALTADDVYNSALFNDVDESSLMDLADEISDKNNTDVEYNQNEKLEQYLIDNNIDINDLLNQL